MTEEKIRAALLKMLMQGEYVYGADISVGPKRYMLHEEFIELKREGYIDWKYLTIDEDGAHWYVTEKGLEFLK